MTENNVVKYKMSYLHKLDVGEKIMFPLEQMCTVRAQASTYGAIWNRVFRTKMDRENRTILVERTM